MPWTSFTSGGGWVRLFPDPEQDRQERLKAEEGPRVVTSHDTLAVVELLYRGFVSPELDALLGAPAAPAPAQDTSVDTSTEARPTFDPAEAAYEPAEDTRAAPPVEESLREAMAWLAKGAPSFGGVFDPFVPRLFCGPYTEAARSRLLPGDARLLMARFESVGHRLASLLSHGLGQTIASASHTTVWTSEETDAMQRDETLLSLPPTVPAMPLSPWMVRSAPMQTYTSAPPFYTAYASGNTSDISVLGMHNENVEYALATLPLWNGARVSLLDMGWADPHLLLLLCANQDRTAWCLGYGTMDPVGKQLTLGAWSPLPWPEFGGEGREAITPAQLAVRPMTNQLAVLGSNQRTWVHIVYAAP